MPTNWWGRNARLAGTCLLSAALFAAAQLAGLGASEDTAKAAPYDLSVLVYAREGGAAQVALSYPTVVDHATVEKALVELARLTGAGISGTRFSDGQQARGMADVGTAVEFAATGLLDERRGALPVGPIVRSLPDWRHMRLVFMVGSGFAWNGPRTATADGFAVRLVSSMPPYEYDVERKSGRVAPPTVAPRKEVEARAVLPALLIGLPAGFAIGWLALGERQRTGSRSGSR